jgi:hypothetical protein
LERQRMRWFGESEEKSDGGIRKGDSAKQWWEDLARSVAKEWEEMHSEEWSVVWMISIVG